MVLWAISGPSQMPAVSAAAVAGLVWLRNAISAKTGMCAAKNHSAMRLIRCTCACSNSVILAGRNAFARMLAISSPHASERIEDCLESLRDRTAEHRNVGDCIALTDFANDREIANIRTLLPHGVATEVAHHAHRIAQHERGRAFDAE